MGVSVSIVYKFFPPLVNHLFRLAQPRLERQNIPFFIFKCKYKPVWVKYISLGVFYFLSLGGRALILIETLSLLRNKSCSMVARPDLGLKQMIWHSQPGNQMKIQTYFSKK